MGGFVAAELNPGGLDLKVTPQGKLEVDVDGIKTGNMLYDRELERQLEVRKYPRIRGEIARSHGTRGGPPL